MYIMCKWKDKNGNHRYDTFIPEHERPATESDIVSSDPQPGEKRKRVSRRPTVAATDWPCITNKTAIYMNGLPISVECTSKIRQH
jgi:hypothetical protein